MSNLNRVSLIEVEQGTLKLQDWTLHDLTLAVAQSAEHRSPWSCVYSIDTDR